MRFCQALAHASRCVPSRSATWRPWVFRTPFSASLQSRNLGRCRWLNIPHRSTGTEIYSPCIGSPFRFPPLPVASVQVAGFDDSATGRSETGESATTQSPGWLRRARWMRTHGRPASPVLGSGPSTAAGTESAAEVGCWLMGCAARGGCAGGVELPLPSDPVLVRRRAPSGAGAGPGRCRRFLGAYRSLTPLVRATRPVAELPGRRTNKDIKSHVGRPFRGLGAD